MIRWLVICAILGITAHLWAVDFMKTPLQRYLQQPKQPVVIDGNLNEWDIAHTPYTISADGKNPLNWMFSNDSVKQITGDSDYSARVAVLWDETYFYVAGEITDDHLQGIAPNLLGNQGPAPWFIDSLMIGLTSYRTQLKTNSPYSKDPFIGLRYAPYGVKPRGEIKQFNPNIIDHKGLYWVVTRNTKLAVRETEKGYNVEAAIPWKDLEYTARPGERLYITFLGADVDPDEDLKQVGWAFGDDMKDQRLFRLDDGHDALGLLTLSKDSITADETLTLRAEFDARTQPATLTMLRVRDTAGNTVFTRTVNQRIALGQTATEVAEIPSGTFTKAGNYSVEAIAVTEKNDRTVVSAPLQVNAVQAAQAPVGEIIHLPAERYSVNAYFEHQGNIYRHGFVTGTADYIPYIRKFIEPGLKQRALYEIDHKGSDGMVFAIRCITLYRLTNDEEYVLLARQIADYTLNTVDTGFMPFTRIALYRYLTWQRDPKSAFAPKDAEKRYRQMLCKIAANPDKDLFAEYGTHNRVWYRYGILKCARMVAEEEKAPIDPRIIDYTDYEAKLLEPLGDSDDASTGYHWVFFNGMIPIFLHTGNLQAFIEHPGFMKTMRRYAEMVSPSGAVPAVCSVSGWPTTGDTIWVFEWLSSLTRDGSFRWRSQRAAEYLYNHLGDREAQYSTFYDGIRDNFCLAYLLGDDTVVPVPPSENSRVTWRHPLVKTSKELQKSRVGFAPDMTDIKRWIPDRMALSSGNDARGLWGLVDLLPAAGHGGELPGNILALMIHDSGLFTGQGYFENSHEYQNIMWVEDLEGMPADPRPMTVEVPIFVEDPAYTFARIQVTAFQHLPIIYTRDILFYKNGFMVVKDRVKFEQTMKVRLGPGYYARCLGPQNGANWFNAFYDEILFTGLGIGRGAMSVRNPAWDLFIYFTERPGYRQDVIDRYQENIYRNSPIQLRQSWMGIARAGQEFTFTSVLLPHAPTEKPADLITPPAGSGKEPRIEILRDDDEVTVVKAVTDYRFWNTESAVVMLNNTGKTVKAGPLESDAQVAVIGLGSDGAINQRSLAGGNILRYIGNDETAQSRTLPVKPLERPAEFVDQATER